MTDFSANALLVFKYIFRSHYIFCPNWVYFLTKPISQLSCNKILSENLILQTKKLCMKRFISYFYWGKQFHFYQLICVFLYFLIITIYKINAYMNMINSWYSKNPKKEIRKHLFHMNIFIQVLRANTQKGKEKVKLSMLYGIDPDYRQLIL